MKKIYNLLVFVSLTVTFSNCSKSSDPTPTNPSVQKIQAVLTGAWTFKSVTVTQTATSKVGIVTNCNGNTLNTVFSTTYFNPYKPVLNYSFGTGKTVKFTQTCVTGTPTYDIGTWVLTENTDGTISLSFTGNNQIYKIKVADITANAIKITEASFPNNTSGYVYLYEYTF